LLKAAASPDEQPQGNSGIVGLLDLFRKRPSPARKDLDGKPLLAPDLWDLVGRGQPHWAGNLNVFIGNKPVERHMAMALRVHPGRTNLAMFLVGEPGKQDAYGFELVGLASDWRSGLYDMKNNGSLVVNSTDVPIEEMQWVESNGGLMVLLATHPPADCQEGNLEVHVTRRSCGKTAVVEFNLNPAAQGPGCYVL
jgi:hypothetical protein